MLGAPVPTKANIRLVPCGMRTCSSCKRDFEPSSRHLHCPACRSRDTCACGQPKRRKSRTCHGCRIPAIASSNGAWKGGRTYHKNGYVMVRMPDHQRASGSYVFEHIVVIERLLGRPLQRDESVHHRNGIRDDNRPENLELWVSAQPSGVRVTDALAWALAVVDRYAAPGEVEEIWRRRGSNPGPKPRSMRHLRV
jgi:HNH endonuclease